MAKRTDIKKILIIGSGPIIIGQACEFDYSGTQACKALRSAGYEIVLVNSNPATIMTDPGMADHTYIEPLTAQRLEQRLRSSSEIVVTTDAGPEEVQALAGTLPSIAACDLEPRDDGLLTARLKTDCGDMYQVSREIFRAFSAGGKDLLEMAVKKASLEEVFLQLTEADSAPAEDADTPLAPGAPAGDADTTAPDTAAPDASGSPADAGEEADEL